MTGNEIRELRIRLGLTLEDMAHALEIAYSTLSGWERGKHKPTPRGVKAMRRLEKKLGRKVEHADSQTDTKQ